MSADFWADLIQSGWYGSFNEVGLGVPCQTELLNHKGASSVLHHGQCTYARESRPTGLKEKTSGMSHFISEKLVMEESVLLFNRLMEQAPIDKRQKLFAYSVSGSYKEKAERGETHFWAALTYVSGVNRFGEVQTQTDTFHACIPKLSDLQRSSAIEQSREAHEWFLRGTLLDKKLKQPEYPLQGPLYIDAVNSVLFPLAEQINLVESNGVTVFISSDGKVLMDRPEHYIRANDGDKYPLVIYRGSFNPFHKGHAAFANSCNGWMVAAFPIMEICLENFWGKPADTESIAHRITMLTSQGYTVLVTRTPTFNNLTTMLQGMGAQKITYLVGADVLNAILGVDNQEWDPRSVSDLAKDVTFVVAEYRIPILAPKDRLKYITYESVPTKIYTPDWKISSTEFKTSKNLSLLPSKVARYVKEHRLYGIQ